MINATWNIIIMFFLVWPSVFPVMAAEADAVYGRITDEKTGGRGSLNLNHQIGQGSYLLAQKIN